VTSATTLFDKFINYFDPKKGLSRKTARLAQNRLMSLARHYEGASFSRRTQGWSPRSSNADAEIKLAGRTLRDRTRYLCRNHALARKGKQVIVNSTIGDGIRLQIRGPEKLRQKVLPLWKEWAETPAIDYYSRHNWYELQRIVMEGWVESGEMLARLYKKRGQEIPSVYRVIEPDYLDSNKEMALPHGNYIIQGIEYDGNGQRINYWCFPQHPGSFLLFLPNSFISQPIPSHEILHIYDMERAEQNRGVTPFHSTLSLFKDFDDFSDAVLMLQKISACFAGFIHDIDAPDTVGRTDPEEEFENLESGMLVKLPTGKSITFNQPPGSGDYPTYSTILMRQLASGLGITYEALSSDYSNATFSSARMAELQFRRNVSRWQGMIISQFCIPTWNEFKKIMSVKMGPEINQLTVGFTTPSHPYIDPQKEILATREALRIGTMSWSEAVREQGYNAEELLDEIQHDFEELKKRGLKLECDPSIELDAKLKLQEQAKSKETA